MEMNGSDRMAQRAIESLSALASSHRLAVFRVLVRAGNSGLPAGDIASRLDMPASSLSFHLSHLRQAELVIDKRVGRSIIYRANFGSMTALIDYLLEECCSESDCVDPAPKQQGSTHETSAC